MCKRNIKTKYILEDAHHKVRDLSHELMPSLLVRFGLLFALDDLCEKNSNSKIKFEFLNTIDTQTRFDEALEMKIYFIISELLNNILKHSKANLAKLETTLENNQLSIKIKDNGKGFDALKEEYVDMVAAGILDPAKVTRSALQNATSVASTLLTTESVVASIKEDTPAMPAGGAGMGMM